MEGWQAQCLAKGIWGAYGTFEWRDPVGNWKDKLEPKKEVWTGDNEFGVLGVDMVPEATEVDDIIQMRKESLWLCPKELQHLRKQSLQTSWKDVAKEAGESGRYPESKGKRELHG